MSFCRWSSDAFQSNIYCYQDFTGLYNIHVAGSRYIIDRSQLIKPVQAVDYVKYHQQISSLIDKAIEIGNIQDIDLPFAGESFQFSSAKETYNKLRELQAIGYHVPEHAFIELKEEMNEN